MADRVSSHSKRKTTQFRGKFVMDHCILLLQHLSNHMHFIKKQLQTLFIYQLVRSKATCSFKFACLKPKLFWVYIKSLLIFLVRRNLINSMFKLHGLIFSMKVIFSKNYFSVSVSNWNSPKNLITSLTNLEFSTYPECFIISWTVWGIP